MKTNKTPKPIARFRVIFDMHDPAEVLVLGADNHPMRGDVLRWLREEIPRLVRATDQNRVPTVSLAERDDAEIGPIMFGGSYATASAYAEPGSVYCMGWWIDSPGAPDFEWLAAALLRAFPGLTLRFGDVWASAHGLWIFEAAS